MHLCEQLTLVGLHGHHHEAVRQVLPHPEAMHTTYGMGGMGGMCGIQWHVWPSPPWGLGTVAMGTVGHHGTPSDIKGCHGCNRWHDKREVGWYSSRG